MSATESTPPPRRTLLVVLTVGVTLLFALAFGFGARYRASLGLLGALATPISASFLLLAVLPMSRARAVAHAMLALLLGVVGSGVIAVLPLVAVVMQKDPSAGLRTALGLAWAYYRLSLGVPGSSMVVTLTGLLTTAISVGVLWNRMRKQGQIS